jgi:hypothetical protein
VTRAPEVLHVGMRGREMNAKAVGCFCRGPLLRRGRERVVSGRRRFIPMLYGLHDAACYGSRLELSVNSVIGGVAFALRYCIVCVCGALLKR